MLRTKFGWSKLINRVLTVVLISFTGPIVADSLYTQQCSEAAVLVIDVPIVSGRNCPGRIPARVDFPLASGSYRQPLGYCWGDGIEPGLEGQSCDEMFGPEYSSWERGDGPVSYLHSKSILLSDDFLVCVARSSTLAYGTPRRQRRHPKLPTRRARTVVARVEASGS